MKGVRINAAKRAMVVGESVSACVVTGTDKVRSGYGNGDCLLLDFSSRVFAVADSSERFPTASRALLQRLARTLSKSPRPEDESGWLALVNSVVARQNYVEKTTLAAVVLDGAGADMRATVMHGGDSLVLFVDQASGEVAYRTGVDMNFAGRAKALSGVATVPVDPETTRIVLATDGVADVARVSGMSVDELCVQALHRRPIPAFPGVVLKFIAIRRGMEHDDIGFVALAPGHPDIPGEGCFILGGTSPREEESIQRRLFAARLPDQWVDADSMDLARMGVLSLGRGTRDAG
ncbi:MAG: hypothetical protein ACLFOY_12165 [Desulfatibacillaceae bacterium]